MKTCFFRSVKRQILNFAVLNCTNNVFEKENLGNIKGCYEKMLLNVCDKMKKE